MNSRSSVSSDFTQHVYANGGVHLARVAVLIRVLCWLKRRMGNKKQDARWIMAESCLPRSRSSRHYPISLCTPVSLLPPPLSNLQQTARITLRVQKAAGCQGNHHPRRHPMTAQGWGRRDWKKGRGCSFGSVRPPGCNRPLALLQHNTPSLTCTYAMHDPAQGPVHAHHQQQKKHPQTLWSRVIIWISVRVINWSNLCAISSDCTYASWFHYTVTLITFLAS